MINNRAFHLNFRTWECEDEPKKIGLIMDAPWS